MQRPRIVTTSWDDGYVKDLKLAERLASKGLAGTFYIPFHGVGGRSVLQAAEIRNLEAQGFEIGAHGYSHRILTELPLPELDEDVTRSIESLEQILGNKVHMFCYPNGRFNQNILRILKGTELKGSRTTRMLHTNTDFEPFEMPVTLQAYPHTAMAYFRNLARAENARALWRHMPTVWSSGNWVDLGRTLFDQVMREGGVWHLYGHSWEIEELGLWPALEEMLDYVAHCREVLYLSNSTLANHFCPAQPSDSQKGMVFTKS